MNQEASDPHRHSASQLLATIEELTRRHHSGANWFFWIAGLSLINTIATHSGSEMGFILGLGITQFIDAIALLANEDKSVDAGSVVTTVAVVLDVLAIASFALWGFLARKGMRWAYIVGMVLFALDTLLLLIGMDLLGIALHAFALFCIFNGFKAHGQLREIMKLVDAARAEDGSPEQAEPAL
ncbi:MAG TPA: hypothetical protein VFY13_10600 [Luteolibacter sp.]|nr:hypothetical protein [Luteolibacter sp.]